MKLIAIVMLLIQLGNVDLLHRPVYHQPSGDISTVETTQYWCGAGEAVDFEADVNFIIHVTPIIEADGKVCEMKEE